ncbi:Stringent starvation protein B [Shewanella baltica BA175]|jgi:stringent starvation protein B|nr:Stringent starvation protein B [Shewanella baltica BA175]
MELILITLLILQFMIIFYKRNRFFPWSTHLNLYRMRDMLKGTDNARKFYLIYSDIIKASKTPYIIIDTNHYGVSVPESKIDHVRDEITLGIQTAAIRRAHYQKNALKFYATFDKISTEVIVPITAIKALYAKEDGIGIEFGEDNSH